LYVTKLGRNIKRTSAEIRTALDHLVESLEFVEGLLKAKNDPVMAKKVPVGRSMLVNFISQCKTNIDSAKSHLNEELKKEADSENLRLIQRKHAELQALQEKQKLLEEEEKERQRLAEKDARAQAKMAKAQDLITGWNQKAAEEEKKKEKKGKKGIPEFIDGDGAAPVVDEADLFGDDSSDEEAEGKASEEMMNKANDDEGKSVKEEENTPKPTHNDLFDSSSDEELIPDTQNASETKKRTADADDEEQLDSSLKKRKIEE